MSRVRFAVVTYDEGVGVPINVIGPFTSAVRADAVARRFQTWANERVELVGCRAVVVDVYGGDQQVAARGVWCWRAGL